MNREQYGLARTLFHDVSELPPGEREAALAECGEDPAVVAQVRLLLEQVERADCFEESRLGDVGRALVAAPGADELEGVVRVGRYAVSRPIGRGGMGIVFEATDADGNRLAVKLLHAGLVSREVSSRFRREAAVLRELRHAGIARFHDSGEARVETRGGGTSSARFLAMEFVDGVGLLRHARERELGDRARLELLAQACDAVHHAHSKGVVHRDLKPENLLVQAGEDEGSGRVKVLDFGVARQMDTGLDTLSRTHAGALLGTLPYMSPEQVSGTRQPVTPRADVYALGVIAFELLTGQLPYDVRGLSIPQAARVIQEAEPLRAGALVARFRGPVETVLRKALEKAPASRYASAAALAADLRALAAGAPIRARRPSALRSGLRLARRHRTLVVGVVGVLVSLLVWVGVATRSAVREAGLRAVAEQRAKEAGWSAHQARIQGAAAALSVADTSAARDQLDACDPERRGWAWRYLDARLDQSVRTARHPELAGRSAAVAFDASGERVWILQLLLADVAEERPDGWRPVRVRVYTWRPAGDGLELVHELADTRGAALDVDAERLVWISADHRVHAARLGGEPLGELFELPPSEHNWVLSSCDGTVLASGRDGFVVRWTAEGGSPEELATDGVRGDACLAEDRLAILHRGRAELHRGGARWVSPGGYAAILAVSPSGSVIAHSRRRVGTDLLQPDRELRAGQGELVPLSLELGREEPALRAVFDAAGRRCATVGYTRVLRLWSLPNGSLERSLVGHAAPVLDLAFSADGARLVSLDRTGELRVWETGRGSSAVVLEGLDERGATALAFGPTGDVAVIARPADTLVTLDTAERRQLGTHVVPGLGRPAALALDARTGRLVLAGSTRTPETERSSLLVLDVETGAVRESAVVREHGRGRPAIALAPDGRLACQDSLHGLLVWDALDLDRAPRHVDLVARERGAVAFDAEGRLLAAKSDRDRVTVLEAESLEPLRELPPAEGVILDLAFHPHRDLLAGVGRDDTVRLWDVEHGVETAALRGHTEPVTSVVFSPDGRVLATGSRDRSVRLWDTEEGAWLLTLSCGDGRVEDLAFSPDGRLLVAVVTGPRVLVWDTVPPGAGTHALGPSRARSLGVLGSEPR